MILKMEPQDYPHSPPTFIRTEFKYFTMARPALGKFESVFAPFSNCYLRQGAHPAWQGAGGRKIARNESRTCFLM